MVARIKLEVTMFVDDNEVEAQAKSLVDHMAKWRPVGHEARPKDTGFETIAVYRENKEWAKVRNG